MNPIKVTVVTPVLNGAKTIRECIDSVKMQDYHGIDHLVIDGCSSDGTLEILEDTGVTYISAKDTGIYDAFNKGITGAEGDIVHILNADDYYAHRSVVSTVVAKMNTKGVDLCHGLVEQIDENRNTVWTIGADVAKKQLLKKMKIAHPSVFIKKKVYEQYGGFSVGFKIAGDYDFLLRIWDNIEKLFMG